MLHVGAAIADHASHRQVTMTQAVLIEKVIATRPPPKLIAHEQIADTNFFNRDFQVAIVEMWVVVRVSGMT